ncbi:MAG: S66 family peptidase [Paraclostridium sp.]|uniref:S66 family peptidase n=1 Tax=Paraclostridium sp. TaxID=2023273 RepID=UPI003F2E958C
MKLTKPKALNIGDNVATVSLSWGGAGDKDILWRYNLGKERLEKDFGLNVIEMDYTLKGSQFIYENPKKRAEDLMNAFKDKSIKAIFSCIGGDESIRILPYIDFKVIKENPKIFMGYSDTTITHLICLKAGLSSFYGPSILGEFAENVKMHEYTFNWIDKVLFKNDTIGKIYSSDKWTSEYIPWIETNKYTQRKMNENNGYELLQGQGIVTGNLIGGCIEVLEMAKGTDIWPLKEVWENSILFFETSEDIPEPKYIEYWLRNYGSLGILNSINGIIFGKPYSNKYYEEYKDVILKVIRDELNLDIPILYNLNFGHTAPMFIIPYGCNAEINCENLSFTILESGVF